MLFLEHSEKKFCRDCQNCILTIHGNKLRVFENNVIMVIPNLQMPEQKKNNLLRGRFSSRDKTYDAKTRQNNIE